MKVTRINQNFINFKSEKTQNIDIKDSQKDLFRQMLCDMPKSNLREKKHEKYLAPNPYAPIIIRLGRNQDIAKYRGPKPFFLSDKKLELDDYQSAAIEHFRDDRNVMVTAPTGTGKTLIAEHAINDILNTGKKVIYTTPLKALCNDKYKQFSALWGDYDKDGNLIGKSKVGIATGDVKINTDAPLVIMTTEVYRNMLTQNSEEKVDKLLKNVRAVIYDEFHYMGDSQRGSVWEEAIMLSPKNTKQLMLSATISNSQPIVDWLNSINHKNPSVFVNVPEEERHVPLKYLSYSGIKGQLGLYDLLDEKIDLDKLKHKNLSSKEKKALSEIGGLFKSEDGLEALQSNFHHIFHNSRTDIKDFVRLLVDFGMPQNKALQTALRLTDKSSRELNRNLLKMDEMKQIPIINLVRELEKKKITPSLYFSYSKKNCKNYMKYASEKLGQILSDKEKIEVLKKINEVKEKGIFLGTDFESDIKPCLLNGFAMHHSGMLPQCKSFIEELGRNKLIKICFATDTLGAGINFPFKSVIFSDFEKYSEDGFEEISTNSFKQGAGRAGRRGIDDIGYIICIPKDKIEVEIPFNKIMEPSDDIQSAFKLSYGLVLSNRFLNEPMRVLGKTFDNFQKQNFDEYLQKSHEMKQLLSKRGFIKTQNGEFVKTRKGKIASKVRGINEILITEIITNQNLMKGITPSELVGIISIFAADKENDFKNIFGISDENLSEKIKTVIDLAKDIKEEESAFGLDSNIKINTDCTQSIKQWSETSDKNSTEVWSKLVKSLLQNHKITTEGDFYKKINFTINILKQLQKAAPTEDLRETSTKALKMLQKSPVNDILLYELDYRK